jgi:hypothetical protein
VKKEKLLVEERDEFDMMDGNQKTLADRLGTSPEDIERKMNAKRKGMIGMTVYWVWICNQIFDLLQLTHN